MSLNDSLRTVALGSLTFSNGLATKTIEGLKTTDKILTARQRNGLSSILVTATCLTADTLSLAAYDTSAKDGYSGTLTDIVVLIDGR